MNLWSRLQVDIEAAIETGTSLSPSPLPFTVQNIPETVVGRVFAVSIDSRNTGKERERLSIRGAHTVTVDMLHSYNTTGGRQETQIEAKGLELQIIDALYQQTKFPTYRVLWQASRRTDSPTLTHFVTSMTFDFEHSFNIDQDS